MIVQFKNNIVSYNTKSAAVLITKSYLKCDIISWVDHYLNWCGFDHIYIFDNETKCCNISELFKNNNRVTVSYITYNDLIKRGGQCGIYSTVLKNNPDTYIAFIDDDEYLWFDKTKWQTINSFITNLIKNNITCYFIPWLFMSYNSNDIKYNRTEPMKDCCKYTGYDINKHFEFIIGKSIVKYNNMRFGNPHFPDNTQIYYSLNPIKTLITDDIWKIGNIKKPDLFLVHYYHRSLVEWEEKLNRKRIDCINKTYKECYIEENSNNMIYPKNVYKYYYDLFN